MLKVACFSDDDDGGHLFLLIFNDERDERERERVCVERDRRDGRDWEDEREAR